MIAELVAMCVGAVLIALGGAGIVLSGRKPAKRLQLFVAFGAGAMLGAAFLHMIPEAATGAGAMLGPGMLAGFLVLFVLEKFVLSHPCEEHECDYHAVGLAAFVGLSFHSIVEGFSLGSGAAGPERLSLAVFLAIALHKLPNAMALASLLLAGGYSKKHTYLLLAGFSLMIPIGALPSYFLITKATGHRLIALSIAVAAGTFLHVAASDLLPQVHRQTKGRMANLVALVVGVALMGLGLLLT